jgi:predicted dithiol-disulfide oxidoreductase (DUF899 family)
MASQVDLQARIATLSAEIQEKQKKLNELRRSVPAEEIADYPLKGSGGREVHPSDLFGEQDDLIVIHNMGSGCPYCTLWADGFNGVVDHLENRAGVVLVSPDSPERQKAFADGRGWRFRMISGQGSPFSHDLGFAEDREGKTYYKPGLSTLRRREDGRIVRVARASFGPGDEFCGIWHIFDLLEGGSQGWAPDFTYEKGEHSK